MPTSALNQISIQYFSLHDSFLIILHPLVSLSFMIITSIINPKDAAFRPMCSESNADVIYVHSVKIKVLVIIQLTQASRDLTTSLASKCPSICKQDTSYI